MKINKKDVGLSNTLIGNAEFTAKQPDLTYTNENGTEQTIQRNNVIEKTVDNEVLEMQLENPIINEIEQRTFEYTLTETKVPQGYENTEFSLNFKFDNSMMMEA